MRHSTTKLVAALALALGCAFAPPAHAFCGFYVGGADTKLFNAATQVVLMRSGTRTVLSMQNNYQGPPSGFALVVPVPVVLQKENVKTLPPAIFAKIDQLSAPRLVEYWEQDPCYVPPPVDPSPPLASPPSPVSEGAAKGGGLGVKVEAQFSVGEYEIVILSAKDAGGLDAWLRLNKYAIPSGAAEHFRPYVTRGSKFFVAKVDPTKVKFADGRATLSPLRFHYDDETFSLPIRLGLINAKDAQDLVVHVLGENQRYEVANYPNTTIPTNFDVAEQARKEFGTFYTALFDQTLAKTPKAVVTEYAWATGTCDPCPGPTLDAADMMTLGADAIPGPDCSGQAQYRSECQPWSRFSSWVVTRLHARYTKETLGDDLVFRTAEPIVGGRESTGPDGSVEHGATKSSTNNFQARYAIRHPWTGPITCKTPRRGIWGGPPASQGIASGPAAAPQAKDMAVAPRGTSLTAYARSSIPEIGFKANVASLPQVSGVSATDVPPGPPPARRSKCGCDVPGLGATAGGEALAALGIAAAFVRRRRRSRA